MTVAAELETKLRDAVEALPRGLRDHVLRVEVEALRLAERYGADKERARIATLGHDLVRHKTDAELLQLAKEHDLQLDAVENASPVLIHGPVATRILLRDYALDDPEILGGIDCHTTARAGMSLLEKVLFVADKIEPGKLGRSPAWQEVRDLSERDLDLALLRFIDLRIDESLTERLPIHQRSLEARNELLQITASGGAYTDRHGLQR
jgi:predicted HD superfamily hydrolase involved in NAD metabolism